MKQRTPRYQLLFGTLILALALPGVALARGSGNSCELKTACADDAERFCPDAQAGWEVRQCLREHEQELSDSCSALFERRRAHRAAHRAVIREACATDAETLCPDAETRRDIHACLRSNHDQLSSTCADVLDSLPRRGWRHGSK